jgi:hypothetical protein
MELFFQAQSSVERRHARHQLFQYLELFSRTSEEAAPLLRHQKDIARLFKNIQAVTSAIPELLHLLK